MRKWISANILLLLCFASLCSKAQMREIYRDANILSNTIRELSFYSPSTGFLAAVDQNQSTLLFTSDSGRTFIKRRITLANVNYNGYPVNLTFGFYLKGVKAFDANNLIAYGDYGLVPSILRSTNGGQTFTLVYWSQFSTLPNSTVEHMIFPENNNIGYAVDRDRILKTIDGGQSWTVVRIDADRKFTRLDAIDNNNVFSFGTDFQTGKLFKTSDAGNSWQEISRPAGTSIQYVDFISNEKGWLLDSQNGSMYYTSNGGISWQLMNDKDVTPFYCGTMKFVNDSTGYATTGFDTYRTSDSGKIWEALHREPDFHYLGYTHSDLQIIGNNQLWCGGDLQLLEINTNLNWPIHPAAYFKIDTTAFAQSGIVQLKNYSKPGLNYEWYVNGQLVSSAFNYSYAHDPYHTTDTIRLVVNNGTYTGSNEQTFYFGPIPKPRLIEFNPAAGTVGAVITVKGKFLSRTNSVYFGNQIATSFTIISDSVLTAVVNEGESGYVRLVAANGTDSLDGFTFIPPAPLIESVNPISATPGTPITIRGKFFLNASSVSFGGIEARSFQVISKTEIRAILADGANGDVTVVTPRGSHSVNGFTVLPLVKVTGFSPGSGTAGSSVTINGQYFDPTVAGNTVFFGGAKGTVVQASSTQLTVTIPIGATYAPLTVITQKQVVSSTAPFQPEFLGADTLSDKSFHLDTSFYTVINNAGSGILGDLDLDGKLDLVTGASGASIFRNTSVIGKISLTLNRALSGNYNPQHYQLHDLNSDGKLDLLLAGVGMWVAKNISVPGDINFQNPQILPDPVNNFSEPAVVDLDGDGRPDIAAWAAYSDLLIFRNTSTTDTITFESAIHLPVGDPWDVVAADLDGDGKPELIASNYYGASIYVYQNKSVPGKLQFELPISFAVNNHPLRDLSIADIDQDGKNDIAVASLANQQSAIALFRNISTGVGNFSFAPHTTITGISDVNSFEFSDMDGDGKIDLVVANRGVLSISVLRNKSTAGNFEFSTRTILTTLPAAQSAYSMFAPVGDLDNDGKPDIVYIGMQANTVTFFRNRVGEKLANAGRDTVFCNPGNSVTLGVPSTAGHSYQWTSSPAGFNSTNAMPVVSPQQTTYYFLKMTSDIGVVTTDTVMVQIQNIVADAGGEQYWICLGTGTVLGTATVPGVTYQWWSNPVGFTSDEPRPAVSPGVTTTYYMRIQSAAGCSSIDSILVTILSTEPGSISISGDTVVQTGHSVELTALFQGGGTYRAITWQDSTAAHSWRDIPNATGNLAYYQPIYTGDKVRATLISLPQCPIRLEFYSNSLRFTVTVPTGIPTIPATQFGIRHYPNPVKSDLYIENLRLNDQWQWAQIVNAEGKLINAPISVSGRRSLHINTSNLLPGTYWLLLYNSKNTRAVMNFIKQQ